MVLIVSPSLPVKSVGDFIALAKAKPGQLNVASAATAASRISPASFSVR